MIDAQSRLRVVVLGYVVRGPLGGMAWLPLQYVRGLADLGHEVLFIEDSDDFPSCYDPSQDATGQDPTYGLAFAARAFGRLGLAKHWAYHDAHTERWHGSESAGVLEFCRSADMVINVSGNSPLRPWLRAIPFRVLIDTDPVFTQIRHIQDPFARRRGSHHNVFFSFAENIIDGGVPNDGFLWRTTRPPIVLDAWPVIRTPPDAPFTTVMLWDSYAEARHDGKRYGMKSRSFPAYLRIPERTRAKLELALGSPGAPRDALRCRGWILRDPLEVTRDPWTYQKYIQGSLAEFSIAKEGYVISRSGWFSERTACYLASGRPAVVQDTGLARHFPLGRGLCTFSSFDEALTGIEAILADPVGHARAARDIASEFFDAKRVLRRLLAEISSTC